MEHSIRSRVDTQPPPEKVPLWVAVLAFGVLFVFFVLLGIGLYKLKEKNVTVGNSAPEFSLSTYDGSIYNNENLYGKIVILYFWASWCTPCEGEALLLENAWRQFDDQNDIVFLGISHTDSEGEALTFIAENKITYPNGSDTKAEIAEAFQIQGVPETVILDRNGTIAYIQIGPFLSTESIVEIVDNLY